MPSNMHLERLKDLSVYYYISNLFSALDPSINIEDGFPESGLVLPTVSVESSTIDAFPGEMGNRKRIKERTWHIDIYAKNKSQRDEIGYRIMDALESTIPVYNYNEGFPPLVSPTQLGCLNIEKLRMEVIMILPDLVDSLYYRSTVGFTAVYNKF